MALFYIFGCMDTGRCSQTQRPLTHQSKKHLYSAAPHHTRKKKLFTALYPSPLCSFFSLLSELILLHKIQASLASTSLSLQSFSDTLPIPSHSPFPFNFLLPSLYFHSLPLHPSPLTFSFSLLLNRAAESRFTFSCYTPN